MKIKRTFATTMREALNIVKLEQGDDAVILGNNKVPGGVEIISAIDYDQAQINAELAAQAAVKRKQTQLKLKQTPVSAPLKPQNTIDFNQSDIRATSNRQEPVFGDINLQGNEKNSGSGRFKGVANVNKHSKSANKTGFDWQSDSPSIKEDNIEFNGKAHAENLLNSIKDLQSQLTESKVDTVKEPKKETRKIDDSRFQKPQMVNDDHHQASQLQKDLLDDVNDASPEQRLEPADLVQPVLNEMKEEMRNMRQLMHSQLNALDWDKYKQRHPIHTVLLNLLTELGIGSDICERVITQMGLSSEDPQLMWRHAIGLLAKLLPVSHGALLDKGGVYALVGSTGVGKTTTIAKIAARFAHMHGKRSVALISTDNFRIGAQEQLQQYAKLLQIPLLTANSSDELSDCLDMLNDKKLVLIDTAGVSQNDMRLSEQFHTLHQGSPNIQPLLVLSANTQLAALNQTIKNFEKVRLAGSIVTKLDEAASLGGVITTSIRHQLPIDFCGLGQQVPEDLEVAKSHRLISKAVVLMQKYKETPNADSMATRFNKIVSFGA